MHVSPLLALLFVNLCLALESQCHVLLLTLYNIIVQHGANKKYE